METQSGGGVRVSELREFSERYAKFETRVYEVEAVEAGRFASLFVDPDSHTLAWNGYLDFGELDYAALGELPHRVWPWKVLPQTPVNLLIAASLFLPSGEVVEGILGEDLSFKRYEELVGDPKQVAAARYDVALAPGGEPEGGLDYAFTAENPEFASSRPARMTVQLPGHQEWPPGVIEWAVAHHLASQELEKAIDPRAAAEAISRVDQDIPA